MKFLSQYLLIVALLFSMQLSAKNPIYENLTYFFQNEDADMSALRAADIALESFLRQVHQFDQNPKKKRIDRITKAIEQEFFKTYKNEANFGDLFLSGFHNSVSARALQVIILEELDIPFQLLENGRELLLIAYPKSERISVEYDQDESFLPWTEDLQTEAVNYLINMGVTTMAQANNYGYSLIDKHFTAKKEISLQELAGFDLMKKGMAAIALRDYVKAAELLNLGKVNYKDERFDYLRFGAMEYAADEMTLDNFLMLDYMLQVYDLTRKQATLDRLKINMSHVYHQALSVRRDLNYAENAKKLVAQKLTREEDRNLILSDFLLIDMLYYYGKDEEEKAFESAKQGLAYNPNNYEIQDVFPNLLLQYLFFNSDFFVEFEDEKASLDSLDLYVANYPFLNESKKITNFFILFKAEEVSDCFTKNKESEGLIRLKELEEILVNYDYNDDEVNESIAYTYSEMAIYYYRQKKYELALEWANKALKLHPDSQIIAQRKKNIEAKL